MKKFMILALSVLFVLSIVSVASAAITPLWNPNGVWGAGAQAGGDEYAGSYLGENVTAKSYLYNWPQDYQTQWVVGTPGEAGPHGGYTDGTNRCRDCHAVHQAQGSYKLLRANARYEACDFCHGLGSGAGKNIAMDNDPTEAPNYSTEYDLGHSLNYGDGTTTYRAPSDSSPAWYPEAQPSGETGFACQDCHSPHATPVRIATIIDNGDGSDGANNTVRFFLLKNPDKADGTDNAADANTKYGDGVTDWTNPVYLTQWCADCHDANIGSYQNKDASGDVNTMGCWDQETGGYNAAYSHDCANAGFVDTQTQIYDANGDEQITAATPDGFPDVNPDDTNNGPTCRQCHAATATGTDAVTNGASATQNWDLEQDWWVAATHLGPTAFGGDADIYQSVAQEAGGDGNWVNGDGSGDQAGYSFPHRSPGYKLLKGDVLNTGGSGDYLDSVCLDCHKWNAGGNYYLP